MAKKPSSINDQLYNTGHGPIGLRLLHVGLLLLASLFLNVAFAAPVFPKLSGRVVDNAHMLDRTAEQRLTALLSKHEQAAGNQVVVVTLPDLGGYDIETYGYQLGRHWGIGQKGRDNGVLLIVAKKERKVRIEVGYGLEGTLTDALSSSIIHSVILPRFRKGDFSGGIEQGTAAIIQALGGKYVAKKRTSPRSGTMQFNSVLFFFVLIVIFWVLMGMRFGGGYGGGGYGGYGGGGFGGGGGGFSGGGGGFGGGGASGGW